MESLKKIFCLGFILGAICINIKAQSIVFHTDLPKRVAENTANKSAHLELYNKSMDSVKTYRQAVEEAWTTTALIQTKIYTNLVNVDEDIKNAKEMGVIAKRIPKILQNVLDAATIAAGKPWLVTYWNETGNVLINKAIDLQKFITTFIMSHNNDSLLIDQSTRDELLWKTYDKVNLLYNISNNMVVLFKEYTFQQALNKVIPYKWYIELDKSISERILNETKWDF